jgi:hypothetical protein
MANFWLHRFFVPRASQIAMHALCVVNASILPVLLPGENFLSSASYCCAHQAFVWAVAKKIW